MATLQVHMHVKLLPCSMASLESGERHPSSPLYGSTSFFLVANLPPIASLRPPTCERPSHSLVPPRHAGMHEVGTPAQLETTLL